MSTPSKVTVLVYVHRNGQDVMVYDSPASAYEGAARGIVVDNLKELTNLSARVHIEKLLAAGNYEEVVDYYNNEVHDEHIDVSEDVLVTGAEPVIAGIISPKCPSCGKTDLEITETYIAYHPVLDLAPDGTLIQVRNALVTGCPSEHFNDGASDFKAHCQACLHEGTPEEFGLGDPSGWEWV